MNIQVLIDSIVRQTTVLVAQLATSAGARAPLAHVANQVFLELVGELKAQGLGNKVIADMFGLALRTYHARVRRLSESKTYQGRSLWEAVLEYVQSKGGTVLRAEVLRRFQYDDEASVRGVLKDLVDSGMLFRSGREQATSYRAAELSDVAEVSAQQTEEEAANLVWVAVHRSGPATQAEIARVLAIGEQELSGALRWLVDAGRVEVLTGDEPRYRCQSIVIPVGAPVGWEAAVFDHFQALVTALVTKLQSGRLQAHLEDVIGGTTYHFDVWPQHPHREEVLSFLKDVRAKGLALRHKVEGYNAQVGLPREEPERVIFYAGQTVLGLWDDENAD
jgi:hypothetical protein